MSALEQAVTYAWAWLYFVEVVAIAFIMLGVFIWILFGGDAELER